MADEKHLSFWRAEVSKKRVIFGVIRCFALAFNAKTVNRTAYRTSGLMALPMVAAMAHQWLKWWYFPENMI